jgi:hypothetical protein
LFVSDPHIDKVDTKKLIKEIAVSIRKTSEERFVVVSTNHYSREYEKLLVSAFDNMIRIINDNENSTVLQVIIRSHSHHIHGKDVRSANPTKLCRNELLLVG